MFIDAKDIGTDIEPFNVKDYLLSTYPNIHGYVNMVRFNEDYKLIRALKLMLSRDKINHKLLVNYVVMAHNAFGKDFIRIVPFAFKGHQVIILNTILTYLSLLEVTLPIDNQFMLDLKNNVERFRG